MSSSVKFLITFLQREHSLKVRDLIHRKDVMDSLATFDPANTLKEINLDIFSQENFHLEETRQGKFQYMLDSFRRAKNARNYEVDDELCYKHRNRGPVRGPDNNLDEYPPYDAKAEKAQAKYERYCDIPELDLVDCMTDTTGDAEFYNQVTQRKYDLFKAYWIITVLQNLNAYNEAIYGLIEFDFDSGTCLDLARECYSYMDNVDMEL